MSSKVKKPFYKRVWVWIIVVIIIIIAGASLGGSKSNNSTNKSASSSKTSGKSISQSDFDSLTVGDLSNNGSGGTSYADVINQLGKPTTSSSSSTDGQSIETATWSNLGGDYSSYVRR